MLKLVFLLLVCVLGIQALESKCLCVYENVIIWESPHHVAKQIGTIRSGSCIHKAKYEQQGRWIKLKEGGFLFHNLLHRIEECEDQDEPNHLSRRAHNCDRCHQYCTCDNYRDDTCQQHCRSCDRYLFSHCDPVWSAWGDCSKSCGGGQRFRSCHDNCHYEHHTEVSEACNTNSCPTAHSYTHGSWGSWSTCSRTCGGGTRTRYCHNCNQHCHHCNWQTEHCNTNDCPKVDGHWSSYSAWSQCSKTCGTGSQIRTRHCIYPDSHNKGHSCPGHATDKQDCHLRTCPVNGHWSHWSHWSDCSKSCGNGTQQSTRTCEYKDPHNKGEACDGETVQTRDCNTHACPSAPVDGHWSAFSTWSVCSKTCGTGNQFRTRHCIYADPLNKGHTCPGHASYARDCRLRDCPDIYTCDKYEIFHEIAELSTTNKTICQDVRVSNTEDFVLQHCNVPRQSTSWTEGRSVFNGTCRNDIALYTPVATFYGHDDHYGSRHVSIAGVYVGCLDNGQGIKVATKICGGFAEVIHIPREHGTSATTNALIPNNPQLFFTIH